MKAGDESETMSADCENLLSKLRLETSPLHKESEELFTAYASVQNLPGYTKHLQVLHGFFETINLPLAAQASFRARLSNWISMLELDIAALNESPVSTERLEAFHPSEDMWLGVQYVLEGSALGSQLIQSQARKSLGRTVPMRYFSAIDEGHPHHWRVFLENINTTAKNEASILEGGRAAFQHFCATVIACRQSSELVT